MLVMALAYALTLTAGLLAESDPIAYPVHKCSLSRTPFSLFRLGLRLLDFLQHSAFCIVLSVFSSASPPLLPKSVGA